MADGSLLSLLFALGYLANHVQETLINNAANQSALQTKYATDSKRRKKRDGFQAREKNATDSKRGKKRDGFQAWEKNATDSKRGKTFILT